MASKATSFRVGKVSAQRRGKVLNLCYYEGGQLPARSRKRQRDKLKRLLNTRAVERMTAERLARTDPQGEVHCWLTTIAT